MSESTRSALRRGAVPTALALCLAAGLTLVALVPDGSSSSAPDTSRAPALPEEQSQAVLDLLAERHFRGTALVALDGEPVVHEAFGYADQEARLPNSPDTVYHLGSLTKPLTAVTVLELRDEGLLRLDGSVCDALDDCPRQWRPITIHDLLTHRSGLADFTDIADIASRPGHTFGHDRMYASLGEQPIESRPGTTFDYSNSNYFLLARIVEEVTGEDYPQVQRERVFDPLDMDDTTAAGDRQLAGVAHGYVTGEDGVPQEAPAFALSNAAGSGDVSSTTRDVLRWSRAVASSELVAADTLAEMLRPVAQLAPGIDYGMGWGLTRWAGGPVHLHRGGISGFSALLATLPDDGVTIILLSNDESTDVLGLGEEVAEVVARRSNQVP